MSLKDLREQSKKTQNVPIYMKGGKNKSKADVDEFDEFDDLVVPKTKKPPVKTKGTFTSSRRGPPVRTPVAAPAPTRGRGRGEDTEMETARKREMVMERGVYKENERVRGRWRGRRRGKEGEGGVERQR